MRRQSSSAVLHLEDAAGLSARRKDEGCTLAEAGRFHEAIGRFQTAIELTPNTAVLHELQAQCYMEAGDTYEAIKAAERAVECEPQWADAHQTLGRARLNLGELELAIVSFEAALRLDPNGMVEVREEDLPGARQLLEKKSEMLAENDHQFLTGHLAQDRSDVPEKGLSKSSRHVLGDGRVCLSALPPSELFRPQHGR